MHKKLSGQVKLNFLSSEIVVCCSQEAQYSGYCMLNLSYSDFLSNCVTLLSDRICMRNTLFCLKHQVIGFIHNSFIHKLIKMVVGSLQKKAELTFDSKQLVCNWVKYFMILL